MVQGCNCAVYGQVRDSRTSCAGGEKMYRGRSEAFAVRKSLK